VDAPIAVLHVTSAPGGGIDRYIRDIARALPRSHVALNAGPDIDVIESLATGDVMPVSAHDTAATTALGATVRLLHVHTIDDVSRARVQALRAQRRIPTALTLHDVSFANPNAFGSGDPPADWLRTIRAFASSMDAVIVPSEYMRNLAASTLPDVSPQVIAPGIDRVPAAGVTLPASFLDARPGEVIAVVGAIGPHKGSALLVDIARSLADMDVALVVIGYTDAHLARGWVAPGLYVHGPYTDDSLAGWLAAYAPRIVLFPNRLPESFSYTLSEVWAAGIPVIVPDDGALGERVRRSGAGWLLPPGFKADSAAALVQRLVGEGGACEWSQVKSRLVNEVDPVTDLPTMARGIAAVYARFGVTPEQLAKRADLSALAPLVVTNINGMAFRQELVRLCEALANAQDALRAQTDEAATQRERAQGLEQWADKLQHDVDEARAWATKLDADVHALNDQLTQRDAALNALNERIAELRRDMDRLELEQAAFHELPRIAQRALRWKARRDRG